MPFLGETAALITAFMWAATSIAFTEASLRVGSLTVNIMRLILAALFLTLTILLLGFEIRLSFNQVFFLAVSGVIGLVFGDTFLFLGFEYVGARISMLIMSSVPLISAGLAFVFLGEVISLWGAIGIILTIIGITIVVLQKDNNPKFQSNRKSKGIFFCFLGAVGQAVALIFAKNAFHYGDINGFVATFYRIVPAILFFFPLLYLLGRLKNPFKIFLNNKKAFKLTLFGSITGPYLGITFSLIAISNTYVGIASTLMATTPIIMLPLVVFYYKEKLSIISIIGTIAAVSGIAILFLK